MKELNKIKGTSDEELDPLFEEAVEILNFFKITKNITTRRSIEIFKTSLQRELCIGYNRAYKIIQQLNDVGYIELPKGWEIKKDKANEICNGQIYNPKLCDIEFSGIDPLFENAARHVIKKNDASTSHLQRVFVIGYNRANKIMEQLEKAGIIGPGMGIRPREILLDIESLENLLTKFSVTLQRQRQ